MKEAAAKVNGRYHGRKQAIDRAVVQRLSQEGLGAAEIARQLGISRASVYRKLAENANSGFVDNQV